MAYLRLLPTKARWAPAWETFNTFSLLLSWVHDFSQIVQDEALMKSM